MRLGAIIGGIDGANPRAIAEQARRLEAEGYDSLWVVQAMSEGFRYPDPFTTLAVAATVTERVELGTAILPVPLYAPGALAQKVASLAQLCGERLTLGVGSGSLEPDFALAERDFSSRGEAFRRGVSVLRDALTMGLAGEHPITPWPQVTSQVRFAYGTWGRWVETAARDYDAWIASMHYRSLEQVTETCARYQAAGGQRAIGSTIRLTPERDGEALAALFAVMRNAGFADAVVLPLPGGVSTRAVRELV